MFGNLVNNRQFLKLLDTKEIQIEPFDNKLLGVVHYTLLPRCIKGRQPDGQYRTIHDFRENKNPCVLQPNQYVVVEIRERIKLLNENIVGQFVPASNLIEDGFGLTAGKIDKKYGTTGEALGASQEIVRFGLKNLLEVPNGISANTRLAHLALYDLRAVATNNVELSEEEFKIRVRRFVKALDDGVSYP